MAKPVTPKVREKILSYAAEHGVEAAARNFKRSTSAVYRWKAQTDNMKVLNGNGAHPPVKSKPKYQLSFVDGKYRYADLHIDVFNPFNAELIVQRFNG